MILNNSDKCLVTLPTDFFYANDLSTNNQAIYGQIQICNVFGNVTKLASTTPLVMLPDEDLQPDLARNCTNTRIGDVTKHGLVTLPNTLGNVTKRDW